MLVMVDEASGETSPHVLVAPRTRIGRAATCDIVLDDSSVSRHHANITLVGDHHILEDEGSSNGTFLNGLRIPTQTGFVLRPGDKIEIARHAIFYGTDGASREGLAALEPAESSYPLSDLVAGAADESEAATEFLRELAAVSAAHGLEGCLRVIARELEASAVAVFVPHATRELDAVAAVPSNARLQGLASLARTIMASERGRILRPRSSGDARDASTRVEPMVSAAAVPLVKGGTPLGVLAVERRSAMRLGRAELARLAVLAARLGEALALQCAGDQDTRFGFES